MSEFDSGGEPVRKRHSADLPGGYCGNCEGHSHRSDNCPNRAKQEAEIPITSCTCHPSLPTSSDPLASIAENIAELVNALKEGRFGIEQYKTGKTIRLNGDPYETSGYRIIITEGEGK